MDAVEARLERLTQTALLEASACGVREGLEGICAEARQLCPKETGALRDSITVRMKTDGGEVIALAPYAAQVEMGTLNTRAQPFLFPALRAREQAAVGSVAGAVRNRIGKEG